MSEINLSSAVRTSLTSLQATADFLSSTQERLATGNRVNSALDDPTAFFTASALNNRASDLGTLLDAQQQAIRTVEVADQGISAIQDLVDSARAQATAALQSDDPAARAEASAAFDDILSQIESLAGDASFNGTNLLEGDNLQVVFNESGSSSLQVEGFNFSDVTSLGLSRTASGAASGATSTVTIDTGNLDDSETLTINSGGVGALDVAVDLSTVFSGDEATVFFSLADLGRGDELEFVIPSGVNSTITVGDTSDTAALLSQLETDITTASGVDFSFEESAGTVTVSSTSADFAVNLFEITPAQGTITAGEVPAGPAEITFFDGDFDQLITVNVDPSDGTSVLEDFQNNTDLENLGFFFEDNGDGSIEVFNTTTDFTVFQENPGNVIGSSNGSFVPPTSPTLLGASDVPINGTTLSPGSDGRTFDAAGIADTINEELQSAAGAGNTPDVIASVSDGNIVLTSTAGNVSANDGIGGDVDVLGGQTAGVGFTTEDEINATLSAIDNALSTLRSAAASLGSDLSTIQVRQDFTSNLINTLQAGAGDLTLADLNEEGANLLTLQTRQQLASTSLSFATQSDQSVLSLF